MKFKIKKSNKTEIVILKLRNLHYNENKEPKLMFN